MDELFGLLHMQVGDTIYLNWHEEGGGEVIRSLSGWELYCIPMYGGDGNLVSVYGEDDLADLIDEANSWT